VHTDSITTAVLATVNASAVGSQPRANAVAAAPEVRAANLRCEDRPNPWLANLAAHSQLTLAPADPAPEGSSDTSPPLNPFSKAYVGLVWDDIKATFTAPASWDTRDWLIFGGVAASVGTVAVFDGDIQGAVQRNRNQTVDDVFKHVQGFGNEYAPGVIGAFYVGGMLFDDPRAKSVALDAASASIIASGLILYPIKYTVGRARPGSNLGAYHFSPFSGSDSFPSGHTTEAFTLATVIAEHYHSIWIDLGCYGIASAVGYARLDLNYHWASDVLAGAAIGTFVGHLVVHVNHNRWGVAIQPVIGPRMNGAKLSWSF
jgi:hypothetical protein